MTFALADRKSDREERKREKEERRKKQRGSLSPSSIVPLFFFLFLSSMPPSSSSSNPSSRPVPWLASPPGPYIAGFRANVLDFVLRSGVAQELPTPPRLVSSSSESNTGGSGGGGGGGGGGSRNRGRGKAEKGAPLRAWLVPLAWPRGSPPSPQPPPPLYIVEEGLDEEQPLVCDQCRVIGKKRRKKFFFHVFFSPPSSSSRFGVPSSRLVPSLSRPFRLPSLSFSFSLAFRLADAPRVHSEVPFHRPQDSSPRSSASASFEKRSALSLQRQSGERRRGLVFVVFCRAFLFLSRPWSESGAGSGSDRRWTSSRERHQSLYLCPRPLCRPALPRGLRGPLSLPLLPCPPAPRLPPLQRLRPPPPRQRP